MELYICRLNAKILHHIRLSLSEIWQIGAWLSMIKYNLLIFLYRKTITIAGCFQLIVTVFNHGVLGLAENPAQETGSWSQNTEGKIRGKSQALGLGFRPSPTPMVKTYYSMSLHCNTAIIVFKRLAIIEWRNRYQLQTSLLGKTGCC